MVRLQNFISKCLHHHTFANMFFNRIFEAHRARIISCSSPKVSVWLTVWPIFPSFRLASLIFSTMLWTWLGLPHPLIVNIPRCVCTHPIDPISIHFYFVFMAMSSQEPMIQFATPLLPFHGMLISMWGKNNHMCFFQTHSTLFVNELTLCSPKMAFVFYQCYHCRPNFNGFISPILRLPRICCFQCGSS